MTPPPGGGFLLQSPPPETVVTPEGFSEVHRLVARTVTEFVETEVEPHADELEHDAFPLVRQLLRRLGALGFLGVDVPERYGGSGADMVTSLIVSECLSRGSFAVSFGAHTVIGTLPLVYFGTEAQKERYLPAMVRGDLIGAYALTEPGAGSDALASQTRAVLEPSGSHYRLWGTKQFITNAGFADVFVTDAKVDGQHFTGFIVDRDTPGLLVGPEERKMGIRGSSTCSLTLEDARVPVDHVLGEVGGGHRVALNILNIGRLKLAAACLGAGKRALRHALRHSWERRQFGRPIGSFGLIQQKLAEMALRIYLLESLVYRTGGLVEHSRASRPPAEALEEYAVECALAKVYGSEALDMVVDELVQIYGGYGYIEDYPAARAYRGARITRIYEGTNEINRLLVTGMLLRRAARGRLPLREASALPEGSPSGGGPLAEEAAQVALAKRAYGLALREAVDRFGEGLREEQEVLA